MKIPVNLRALENRNYRIYFITQYISMSGSWMQGMVQSWLIYRLTSSGLWIGALVVCNHGTAFVTSSIAGLIADRLERRRILVGIEVVAMAQAMILGALVYTAMIQVWHLLILSIVLGLYNGFEITTRHAFAADLVGKENIGSAIALNSVAVNASRFTGPAVGGLLIARIGEAGCFFMNGLTNLITIAGLMRMDMPYHPTYRTTKTTALQDLREAARYVRNAPRVRRIFVLATFMSFIGFPYAVLLPIFAKDVLHGDAQTLGWLMGASGVGAMLGAIRAATPAQAGLARGMLWHVIGMGVALVLLGASHWLALSLVAAFLLGYAMMGAFPKLNTTIQNEVSDSMRGRVLGFYTMTFFGAAPIGSLIEGWLADHVGAPAVSIGAGTITLAVAAAIAARESGRAQSGNMRQTI